MKRFYVNVRVQDNTTRTDVDELIYVDALTAEQAKEQTKQRFRDVYGRPPYAERYDVISTSSIPQA